jgi:hypothetical protein
VLISPEGETRSWKTLSILAISSNVAGAILGILLRISIDPPDRLQVLLVGRTTAARSGL